MAIEPILSGLNKIKRKGDGRWIACCPVHDDKIPSMALRELPDGRILMHCFGCGANGVEIVEALGLDIDELFPTKIETGYRKINKPFTADDILNVLFRETTLVLMAANDMLEGVIPDIEDMKRLEVAKNRIYHAVEYGKN